MFLHRFLHNSREPLCLGKLEGQKNDQKRIPRNAPTCAISHVANKDNYTCSWQACFSVIHITIVEVLSFIKLSSSIVETGLYTIICRVAFVFHIIFSFLWVYLHSFNAKMIYVKK